MDTGTVRYYSIVSISAESEATLDSCTTSTSEHRSTVESSNQVPGENAVEKNIMRRTAYCHESRQTEDRCINQGKGR